MIKDAGRNIDFQECAARCLVRREGTEQVDLLVISIHSVITGLPGKRLMISGLASQGCEALFLLKHVRLTTGAELSLLLHQSHRVGEVAQADPGSPGSEWPRHIHVRPPQAIHTR